jgi:hypothetical protein
MALWEPKYVQVLIRIVETTRGFPTHGMFFGPILLKLYYSDCMVARNTKVWCNWNFRAVVATATLPIRYSGNLHIWPELIFDLYDFQNKLLFSPIHKYVLAMENRYIRKSMFARELFRTIIQYNPKGH